MTNDEFNTHYSARDFSNEDMRGVTVMPNMVFDGVDFSGAMLAGVNMNGCTFRRCVFHRAVMEGAILNGSSFYACKFIGTFMAGIDLTDTTFTDCDLMVNAVFVDATNTVFVGGRIRGTDFSAVNFTNVKIHDIDIQSSQFNNAVFKDASIKRVKFLGSTLKGADFSEVVSLEECIGDGRYMKSLQIFQFPVVYTKDVIQIGDHCYPVYTWKEFDDMDAFGKSGFTVDSWVYLDKKRRTIDPTILYRLPEILNLVTKFPAE